MGFSLLRFYFRTSQGAQSANLGKIGNGYNGNRPTVPDWTKTLSVDEYNARLAHYSAKIAQRYGNAVFAFALENEANIAALHIQGGWREGDWSKERVMSVWQTIAHALAKEAPDIETILTLAAVDNWEDWAKEAMDNFAFDAIGLQIYPCGTDPDPDKVADAKKDLQKQLLWRSHGISPKRDTIPSCARTKSKPVTSKNGLTLLARRRQRHFFL